MRDPIINPTTFQEKIIVEGTGSALVAASDRWQGPSKLRRAASAVMRRESRELCRLIASGL